MYKEQCKLTQIKNRGGLIDPHVDIFKICRAAEKNLRSSDLAQKNFYNRLSIRLMRQFTDVSLFSNTFFESKKTECDHSHFLIKDIVSMSGYITLQKVKTLIKKKISSFQRLLS